MVVSIAATTKRFECNVRAEPNNGAGQVSQSIPLEAQDGSLYVQSGRLV